MVIKKGEKMKEFFIEDIVKEVQDDFKNRQEERKPFEAIWEINNNFFMGNQYSFINSFGDINDYGKKFYWQEREVFNHIAPIVEARLSKLSAVRPKTNVMPASSEDKDLKVAKLSNDILSFVYDKINMKGLISQANRWSELTGTCFYKVTWNDGLGNVVGIGDDGKKIHEGEVEVCVVPPYEIYPDNAVKSELDDCFSIIHAKAYNIKDIKNIWNVDVEPETVDTLSLSLSDTVGGHGFNTKVNTLKRKTQNDQAIVIERYEAPSAECPNGRLVIVCQDKLLYIGELPYKNMNAGKRGFPFIKQVAIAQPACFWGTSVVERIIPVQRAYNAVKNRKHEYLNRLSMGVLTVEDGSVDTENLEEEGLCPGKVISYRQGANPPKMLGVEQLPSSFQEEEEQLLNEFMEISGVTNLLANSSISHSWSGTALTLLIEQDKERMQITIDEIYGAIEKVSRHILRLYRQYALTPRLLNVSNDNGDSHVIYWLNSDLNQEEIHFSSAEDENNDLTKKREQILQLLDKGLLFNSSGKISESSRIKILELFNLGSFESNTDESVLQKNYADSENFKIVKKEDVEVLEIDNHEIHLNSHISFMLDKEFEKAKKLDRSLKVRFLNHIREHKKMMNNN